MHVTFLTHIFGTGAANTIMDTFALLLMAVAIGIWVMEFSGHTLSRHGFVRNNLKWNARTTSIVAVCAALYIAGRPLQVQLVPGIGGINPSFSIGPALAILFGLPGAIGVAFSMPIGDAISGALTIGSAAGMLGQTFYVWLPYKLVTNPRLNSKSAWIRLYLALIPGGLLLSITICGWLDVVKLVPPAVAWGPVLASTLLNQSLLPYIVTPLLLTALFPLVQQWGMYHADLPSATRSVTPRRTLRDGDSSLHVTEIPLTSAPGVTEVQPESHREG